MTPERIRHNLTTKPLPPPPFLSEYYVSYHGLPRWWQWSKTHLPMHETETQIHFVAQEDPLEEGMAIHSSIRAWRIPWTEEPSGLQSIGGKTQATQHTHTVPINT